MTAHIHFQFDTEEALSLTVQNRDGFVAVLSNRLMSFIVTIETEIVVVRIIRIVVPNDSPTVVASGIMTIIAGKPRTDSLQQILDAYYHLHGETIIPRQMMHTGNSILSDVASGNVFGATTCLVRNIGKLGRVIRIVRPKERELCHELERRGLWRKHHVRVKGDQYYQLGESLSFMLHD